MEQQDIFQASLIERKYQELANNLEIISTQITELEKFREDIAFLKKSKGKEALSQIGKGVYIKSEIKDKSHLFVEVGAGAVVKKTPEETIKVIENQISSLKQAHIQILSELEIYQTQLEAIMNKIEK
jgi:prefoldin alpha subunit